ncbi:uncharacterized protein FPOAC1_013733, partial [Fusarium poae]
MVSTGGKAPWRPSNVVAARFTFINEVRGLRKDSQQRLIAATKDLGNAAKNKDLDLQRETVKKDVLNILRNDTQREQDGVFSLLSSWDMMDAIKSAIHGEKKQETSPVPAMTPKHHDTTNTTTH